MLDGMSGDPTGDAGDLASKLAADGSDGSDGSEALARELVRNPTGLGSAAEALAAVVAARRRAAERSAGANEATLSAETAGLEAAHQRALELLQAAEAAHDPD
jgi:hypothetical protein